MKNSKLVTIGLLSLAVLVGLGLSVKPWKVFFEQRERTAQYQKQMREAEDRRVDLTKQKSRLEGPMGREQAARDSGFVKPEETPVSGR